LVRNRWSSHQSPLERSASVQILDEFANVARRKMKASWPEIGAMQASLRGLLSARPLTIDTHETGLAIAERYGLAVYDAMIVASALEAGCQTLWPEDLQDGMVLNGEVRVVNPFTARRG
jgi:predicted nucleic acid-binding protein